MFSPIKSIVRAVGAALVIVIACAAVYSLSSRQLPDDQVRSPSASSSEAPTAIVKKVIDGDTIELAIDGTDERVRLIGIDTPESVARNTPKQCYGSEASEELRRLLPEGTTVRYFRGKEARDRYDRLLLYVYRSEDGLFINRWMVENGFAAAVSYRPNTEFESEFASLEHAARSSQLGLWDACDGPDQPLK